jgi:hypothetical protein
VEWMTLSLRSGVAAALYKLAAQVHNLCCCTSQATVYSTLTTICCFGMVGFELWIWDRSSQLHLSRSQGQVSIICLASLSVSQCNYRAIISLWPPSIISSMYWNTECNNSSVVLIWSVNLAYLRILPLKFQVNPQFSRFTGISAWGGRRWMEFGRTL